MQAVMMVEYHKQYLKLMNSKLLTSKKASFELSVNFLVVLILSIVLLGLGIGLITTLVTKGDEWQQDVIDANRGSVREALDSGDLVSVYPKTLTAQRGESVDFLIGVRNEGDDRVSSNFTINIIKDRGADPSPSPLFSKASFSVKNNQQNYQPVRLIVAKNIMRGSYIFNVYVCRQNTECTSDSLKRYGNLQKIQVNVK